MNKYKYKIHSSFLINKHQTRNLITSKLIHLHNKPFKLIVYFQEAQPQFLMLLYMTLKRKYSHTSFYELPLYETSELRNRFLEVTASTKNQQIL